MSEEPPEFHTKTLSPLSPLPVHPPEPANIPVLRNQIDPVFNMTSTHLETESNDQTTQDGTTLQAQPDSPSSDSSFGDAYKEQASIEAAGKNVTASEDVSAVDDYAMTFDSDGEDQAQNQDVSQANADLKTESLTSNSATNAGTSSETTQEISLPAAQNAQASTTSQSEPHPTNTTTTEPIAEPPLPQPAQISEPDKAQTSSYDDVAGGGVDIQQLLDNITANAEKNESATQTASITTLPIPTHSSLPPRPQIPLASPSNDTPTYPPQGLFPPASASYRPPGAPPSLVGAGAPGTSTAPMGGLPPPPGTSFAHLGQIEQMNIPLDHRDDTDNPEKRWGPEIQRLYDIFLEEERKNVTEGTWEKFPMGSRLFVGNLASEQVTKRDVFHIFHRYGRIAQISIKQAYGFVQYYSAEACQAALISQEGADLRGKKIHLEVSKPQKSHNQQRNSTGGQSDRNTQNDRNKQGRNNDRQDRNRSGRDDYGRDQRQGRDDYRPRRSLTPPRINDRNRDVYGTPRSSRDSYGRDRRERSPPPYDHRGYDNYRERGLSPRRDSYQDAELQIPHRDPRNVPDIQFIVVEQLNRDFVSWCENEVRSRGVKTETMFLSSRLSLDAVIQRQVVEGVIAVSQLDLRAQSTSKISLRVFNRSAGVNNVRFDEYQGLDPKIAAELVLRDKQTQLAPPAPNPYAPPPQQYAPPPQLSYQQPPPHIPQAPPAAVPNLAGLANLDNATLQKLLGGFNSAQQQSVPVAAQNSNIDLVGLLGMLNQQQAAPQQLPTQQPAYGVPPQQQQQQYGGYNLQSPVNGTPYGAPQPNGQAQAQGNAQSVQNIMAALAKARQ